MAVDLFSHHGLASFLKVVASRHSIEVMLLVTIKSQTKILHAHLSVAPRLIITSFIHINISPWSGHQQGSSNRTPNTAYRSRSEEHTSELQSQ